MKSLCALSRALRSSILACSLVLLAVASGCATTKTYHLNLDVTTAPADFASVANIAEEMGYQVTRLATAVNVRYDHETWIYYAMNEYDYSMAIVVDSDVASNQMNERLEGAKAKGEEIWSRAMAIRQQRLRATQPGAPGPAIPPPPAS